MANSSNYLSIYWLRLEGKVIKKAASFKLFFLNWLICYWTSSHPADLQEKINMYAFSPTMLGKEVISFSLDWLLDVWYILISIVLPRTWKSIEPTFTPVGKLLEFWGFNSYNIYSGTELNAIIFRCLILPSLS